MSQKRGRHDTSGAAEHAGLESRLTRRKLLAGIGGITLGAATLSFSQWHDSIAARTTTSALPARAYDAEVPYRWFMLMDDLLRETPGFTPPVASRAIAYAGLALYEALVPGMPAYQSYLAQRTDFDGWLPDRTHVTDHWPTLANGALASTLRRLFAPAAPELQQAIEDLEMELFDHYRWQIPAGHLVSSLRRGRYVGFSIVRWSRSDGGHEGYLHNFPDNYDPPHGPGLWQPTPPDFLPALQPTWGTNRTFAIGDPASVPVVPPPPFSTEPGSAFYQSAMEVYRAVNELTSEQETIARFWADDPGATSTPPGHSLSILNQIVRQEDVDLGRAAEAYARLGMAVADAFICCWHTKYAFNLVRPISYIQEHIDPEWGDPLPVTTPPFPEYTSGHSVQSGAAAQVMTDLFGDVAFTDHAHVRLGFQPRHFDSFFDFADEAAISRLYGGIHYREAIDEGVLQGMLVGKRVSNFELRRLAIT